MLIYATRILALFSAKYAAAFFIPFPAAVNAALRFALLSLRALNIRFFEEKDVLSLLW